MENQNKIWRVCSACKKEIKFGQIYQSCSVSTCKKYVYCSVDCWEIHVPLMNHKNAWAEEERAPQFSSELTQNEQANAPRRRIVQTPPSSTGTSASSKNQNYSPDILIVASKLKQFVKDVSELNTSANVMDALSDMVRELTFRAIENAKADGRKTLMDRDFNNIL